ncbi:MAG: VOC family protein, partial [Gemmatimonadetes bacterium]|nr:VOC family protein [Gemmatimonadota bacterium]
MNVRRSWIALASVGLVAALAAAALLRGRFASGGFQSDFVLDRADLVSEGRNPFFVLEPGWVLELAGADTRLLVTVLDETEVVDGVESRVVEEREWEDGELVEVSRNFFALGRRTGDLFYFGEDVDIWEGGRVTGHEGAWRAGVDGAQAGLMLPGSPGPGFRHYQEVAEGIAMDRAEILSVGDTVTVPAGRFTGALRVQETTPLEPWAREEKLYAPGVGLLRDGAAELVRWGTPAAAGGSAAPGARTCRAPDARVALDHVILAVPDLDAAAAAYRSLGFTLKEGRLHANGLLNKHVKLADGSEKALMRLGREPGDAMARRYAELLAGGGGGAYAAFRASQAAVLAAAEAVGVAADPTRDATIGYVTLPGPGLEAVFFFETEVTVTDPDSLLTHANGAEGLTQAWVEGGEALGRLLVALGGVACDAVRLPDGREAQVFG